MQIIAASVRQGEKTGDRERILELVVRLDQRGEPDPAPQDPTPPYCRLVSDEREEWSGTLQAGGDRWVINSSLGDDEPIRVLHMHRLRPGDHLTLCDPSGKPVSFRVERVTPKHHNQR